MSLIGKTKSEKIWNYLLKKINNEYGVAGLMGNLYAESALNPKNVQNTFEKKLGLSDENYTNAVDDGSYINFVKDGAGYGLAQWTYYTRKQELLDYAKSHKVSVGHLEMQLSFLWKEMTKTFPKVANALKNAKSIRQASDIVLTQYEKPADQSENMKKRRANFGQQYYQKYSTSINRGESGAETVIKPVEKPINIIECFGTVNTNYAPNRKIEWIVFHYTAGTTSKPGSALNLARAYASGSMRASSDFTVDDSAIVQYNKDIENRLTWGVGGNKYASKSTPLAGMYYGKCTNRNSIQIEVCSNKVNKKSLLASDTDWYFTDSELKLTAQLINYLMKKYNIDKDHVIMHHQVTGKVCPNPWTVTADRLNGWYEFLKMIDGTSSNINTPISPTNTPVKNSYRVRVTTDALNIRKGPGINYAKVGQICDKGVYTIVETLGTWGRLKSDAGWISLNYTKRM